MTGNSSSPVITVCLVVNSEPTTIAIVNTATLIASALGIVPQILIFPPHLVTAKNTSLTCNKNTTSVTGCIAPAVTTESLAIAVVLVIVADQRVDSVIAVLNFESIKTTDPAALAVVGCRLLCWMRLGRGRAGRGGILIVPTCQHAVGRGSVNGSEETLNSVPGIGIGCERIVIEV